MFEANAPLDFEELPPAEQMSRILSFCKQALDFADGATLWIRMFAWSGLPSAREKLALLADAERIAGIWINNSPERQDIWRSLCIAEPSNSRIKLRLNRLLRPVCTPLPVLTDEEKRRRKAEGWFVHQKIERLQNELEQQRAAILEHRNKPN